MDYLQSDKGYADPVGSGGFQNDPQEEDAFVYWAAKKPETVVKACRERIDTYFNDFRQNSFFDRIYRSWLYYHNLYFGVDSFNLFGSDVKALGEQGELTGLSVNHFRNILQNIIILTTRDRPSTQCRATNADSESLQDARTGDGLVDYYMREKRVEQKLFRAVENAVVTTAGFVSCEWDHMSGEPVRGDVQTGNLVYSGDVRVSTPTLLDVITDTELREWVDNEWYIVREYVNRWDLAATYPEKKEEILRATEPEANYWGLVKTQKRHDRISLWKFYHNRTPALPTGRCLYFVGDTVCKDGKLPPEYEKAPIYRVTPAEILMTSQGYSPALDLQGLQEAINDEFSAVLSCHDAFAVQNIWTPIGSNITAAQLSGGLRLLQSASEPKALQLTSVPTDAYKFIELMVQSQEMVSGVNSVTRGQPEASLKSGKALSIVDAKAVQFATPLIGSYYALLEDVGTALIKILQEHIDDSEKVFTVMGKFNRATRKTYNQKTLKSISRVVVDSANPMIKTISGRMDLAQMLVENNFVKTPEELITVLTTGQIDPLLKSDTATLSHLADENEVLLAGGIAPILKSDYHSLHLREQLALLNTVEVRLNDKISANVLGHCLVHIVFLHLPDVIDLQIAQGFQVPQLSPSLAPTMLQQIPQELLATLPPDAIALLQAPPGPVIPAAPPQIPPQSPNPPPTPPAGGGGPKAPPQRLMKQMQNEASPDQTMAAAGAGAPY